MSKLYNKYIELKNKKDDIYLFRVGIFYIFIGDDAIKMSEVLNLKCVAFTNDTVKCGFPIPIEDIILILLFKQYLISSFFVSIVSQASTT